MDAICQVSFSEATPAWGFDAGPGTVLMDLWRKRLEADEAHAPGRVHYGLLDALLADPYFAKKPPKSAPKDLFSAAWLDAKLAPFAHLSHSDVQATLCELTARCVRSALALYAADTQQVQVTGAGAADASLMRRLQVLLPNARVSAEAMPGSAQTLLTAPVA